MEPPKCPICETAHWSRQPHQFAKTKAAKPIQAEALIDRAGARPGSGAHNLKDPAAATSRPAPEPIARSAPARVSAKPGKAETPAGGTAKPPRVKKRKKAKKKRAAK